MLAELPPYRPGADSNCMVLPLPVYPGLFKEPGEKYSVEEYRTNLIQTVEEESMQLSSNLLTSFYRYLESACSVENGSYLKVPLWKQR